MPQNATNKNNASKEKSLDILFNNILKELSNLEMIALIDSQGLPIASITKSQDEEVVSALTAVFDSFVNRVKQEFSSDDFFNIMQIGDKKFCFMNAGNDTILTLISNLGEADNKLKVYGKFVSSKIAAILGGNNEISLEIPNILQVIARYRNGELPDGDYIGKIIVCGDFSVGKTSLIRRFVDNKFQENYISTIGVDITQKKIDLSDSCVVNFLIWDIGGQKSLNAGHRNRFYQGAEGALLVFDRTRRESFENIMTWLDDISKEVGPNVPKIIVGNKSDLTNSIVISNEEIKQFAGKLGYEYFVTSAKTGENVEEAFKYLAYWLVR